MVIQVERSYRSVSLPSCVCYGKYLILVNCSTLNQVTSIYGHMLLLVFSKARLQLNASVCYINIIML